MKNSVRWGGVAAALLVMAMTAPGASAADQAAPKDNAPVEIIDIKGVKVDKQVSDEAKEIIAADASAAAAAANVCGTDYTISAGAARYGANASLYLWWNGKYSGSNKLYDKYICGVLFNDTGYTANMGIRLRTNYTADPAQEDFGYYKSYAGPVYQKRGGCGKAYSYMLTGSGVVVDNTYTMSGCN